MCEIIDCQCFPSTAVRQTLFQGNSFCDNLSDVSFLSADLMPVIVSVLRSFELLMPNQHLPGEIGII